MGWGSCIVCLLTARGCPGLSIRELGNDLASGCPGKVMLQLCVSVDQSNVWAHTSYGLSILSRLEMGNVG